MRHRLGYYCCGSFKNAGVSVRLALSNGYRQQPSISSMSRSTVVATSCRFLNTAPEPSIPSELLEAIQEQKCTTQAVLQNLKQQGDTVIGSVTVRTILNGMRGSQLLLCDTSEVNPRYGISYRGKPIQELIQEMPGAEDHATVCSLRRATDNFSISRTRHVANELFGSFVKRLPLSEGLLWLLLTGKVPSRESALLLRDELVKRADLPSHARQAINAVSSRLHPMAQFIIGITACQSESRFRKAYRDGSMKKAEYWKYALEDGLSLIAKVPAIASLIYHRMPKDKSQDQLQAREPLPIDPTLDWAANIARGLGFPSSEMADVMRLYMFLHADHEGGNVSAHTAHLVGSALSDPYLSFAASMAGLAGPLHGLANQDCLIFLRQMHDYFQQRQRKPSEASVEQYIKEEYLSKGRVVPGFGHAVLRTVDPRFLIQQEFSRECIKDDPLVNLLAITTKVVPPILLATGKVSNPYPNVDAHSGVILNHYGIAEQTFFTVLFGTSRSIGVVAQLVWDRLLQLPIERPKSVTLDVLSKQLNQERSKR